MDCIRSARKDGGRCDLRRRLRGRDRFGRFDAGLEIEIFRRPASEARALDAGLDEFLDMSGNEMEPAEVARQRLLKATAGQFVINAIAAQWLAASSAASIVALAVLKAAISCSLGGLGALAAEAIAAPASPVICGSGSTATPLR